MELARELSTEEAAEFERVARNQQELSLQDCVNMLEPNDTHLHKTAPGSPGASEGSPSDPQISGIPMTPQELDLISYTLEGLEKLGDNDVERLLAEDVDLNTWTPTTNF